MFLIALNVLFVISFIGFAYVNLNDSDSWLWVPIYGAAAAVCGFAAFGSYYPTVYLLLMGFYLAYAIILFFRKDGFLEWIVKYNTPSIVETMQAKKPYIENTREFFGLLIIACAMLINYLAY